MDLILDFVMIYVFMKVIASIINFRVFIEVDCEEKDQIR